LAHKGGKVVIPMHRPPLPQGDTHGTHFCSLTWSFQLHNGPGVDSAPNRNEYQEYFLGG